MKVIKHILLRFIFLLTAIQLLNLSIDSDGFFLNAEKSVPYEFDDLDSYAELMLELLSGDDQLISENDNDGGSTDQNHSQKYNPLPLFTGAAFPPEFYSCLAEKKSHYSPANFFRISSGYDGVPVPPPNIS